MKYIQSILLAVTLLAIGINFYQDHQRQQLLEKKIQSAAVTPVTNTEPSPFDKPATDPFYESKAVITGPSTSISFDRDQHDFGKIAEGKKYTTSFTFTNTGTSDLFISNAAGSCGCTVPSWPSEPIKPGATGQIKVEFDAKGRGGVQTKTVTVTSNTTPSKNVLQLRSIVIPKED